MHFSSNIWHLNDFRNLWRKKKIQGRRKRNGSDEIWLLWNLSVPGAALLHMLAFWDAHLCDALFSVLPLHATTQAHNYSSVPVCGVKLPAA